MAHELNFKTGTTYDTLAKWPYLLFADQELGTFGGYINNSLEGTLFDDTTPSPPDGIITISSGVFTPNWYYQHPDAAYTQELPTAISIVSGLCTVTAVNLYVVGDIISLNGVEWDATHPNVNGVWKIFSVDENASFTFEINAEDASSFSLTNAIITKGAVFEIRDNRPTTDARGLSCTSVLFTPKPIYSVGVGYKRILPSDLYTRFRFQTGSDIIPKGGINSNLFDITDSANNNIKPVLWAYFFGNNDQTIASRAAATHFEIAFNSYAVVLRPSGNGSNLEFAILKFNWGTDVNDWLNSVVGTDRFNKYTVSEKELGYLISTNPEVGKIAGRAAVTELAKSDSLVYDSEFPVKLNLKITIRKHLLSDSILDGTYLVNVMINDNYDVFGEGAHYDSVLHAYISKPGLDATGVGHFNLTDGTQPHDSLLMPMMYFKFNNIDEQNVGLPGFDLSIPGSSKIVQDSLFFRQINSAAVAAGTSYLY
jgi:hypothetical protein